MSLLRAFVRVTTIFSLFILFGRCGRSSVATERPVTEVDSIITSFRDEAYKRGIEVKTSAEDLVVQFSDLGKHSGSCKPNVRPRIITIDSLVWRHSPRGVREMLLFHELGHCLLGLGHNNEILALGECKSWMRDNTDRCVLNYGNGAWREYYIDQLFSKSLSGPSWYEDTTRPSVQGEMISHKLLVKHRLHFLDSSYLTNCSNFSIRIHLPDSLGYGSVYLIVNEYAISLELRHTGFGLEQQHTVFLNDGFYRDEGIISTAKAIEGRLVRDIIVERKPSQMFVFLDDRIRLCIPLAGPKIKIGAYSTYDDVTLDLF